MFSSLSALLLAVLSFSTATASSSPPLVPRAMDMHPKTPRDDSPKKPMKPLNYGVILYQAFEPLDVFGPLTALQTASRYHKMNLALIAETMEPVTTEPVTPRMNPENSTFFQEVVPTHTFETAPDLDVLIVPGGLGSRSPFLNATIDFIAERFDSVQYFITVCTGSMLAAKAGVLDGRNATANKASWNETVALGPDVNWIPTARWVVDGKVWTSSGVSAGIDLTLAFIEHIYGEENATTIGNYMEYERAESSRDDPFSEIFDVPDQSYGEVYADGDADTNDSYVDERLLGKK